MRVLKMEEVLIYFQSQGNVPPIQGYDTLRVLDLCEKVQLGAGKHQPRIQADRPSQHVTKIL